MADIDNLDFSIILHDEEFDKKIKTNMELAKQFNITVSDLLEVQSKIEGMSAAQARAAKTQVQMMNMVSAEKQRAEIRSAKAAEAIINTHNLALQKQATELQRTAAAAARAQKAQHGLNSEFSLQTRLISNAKTLFTSYVSVFALKHFITNLARVRGEFELQQVALRAIMQDVAMADKTFGQLKNLAVESPFRFKELTQYAKMLSAYNIANEDLFKTTKQIADLSAGLGAGMDRLILAYGQVRSAEFLRGQEVRQFSEAGINLVSELAKKFTELEGTVVSAGEVFDRISNRMVTFEMVRDVIDDLTSEGGRFFDQQRLQANTLFGMIEKLADAYDIMLNDMGQANEGMLKGGVNMLLSLIKHWRTVAAVLGTVTSAFLVYKAITMGYRGYEWALKTVAALQQTKEALRAATKEQIALNRAMKVNAYAAAIGLIVGLTTAIYSAVTASSRFNRELESISLDKLSKVKDDLYVFEKLVKAVDNNVRGTKEYNDALTQLKRRFGDYIPDLDDAISRNEKLADRIKDVSEAIKNQSLSTAVEETTSKIDEQFSDSISKAIAKIQQEISSIPGLTKEVAATLTGQFTAQIERDVKNGVYITYGYLYTEIRRLIKELEIPVDWDRVNYHEGISAAEWGRDLAERLTEKFEAQELAIIRLNAHYKALGANIETTSEQMKKLADAEAQYNEVVEKINNDTEVTAAEKKSKIREERLKFLGNVINDVFRNNAKAAKPYVEELNNITYASKNLAGVYNALVLSSKKLNDVQKQSLLVQNNESFSEKIKNVTSQYEAAIRKYQELSTEIATISASPELYSFGYEGSLEAAKKDQEAVKQQIEGLKELLDLFKRQEASSAGNNARIQSLEAEIKKIQEAQQAYEKLNRIMSSEQAVVKLQGIEGYEDIISQVVEAAGGKMELSTGDFEKTIDPLLVKLQALGEEGRKAADKIREAFERTRRENAIKGIEDDLKRMFSTMKRELAEYQENYKQYQDLIKQGFGKEQAINLSFGALANNPDLDQYLAGSIEKMLSVTGKSVKLDSGIFLSFKEQMGDVFDTLTEDEKQYIENADNIRRAGFQERFNEGLELVNQVRSNSEKIEAIEANAAEKIAQIRKDILAGRIPLDTGHEMIEAVQQLADEQIAALQSEMLKLTNFYKRLFGSLEKYSLSSLKTIRERTQQTIDSATFSQDGKTVSVDIVADDGSIKKATISLQEYLSLVKQLEQVNNAISGRNPFAAMRDAISSYDTQIEAADKALQKFQEDHADAVTKARETDEESRTADQKALIAQEDALKKNAKDLRKDRLAAVGAEVGKIGAGINQVASSAQGMFESMGLDELGDAVGFIGEMSDGISSIVQSVMSGDVVGAIVGVFSTITSVFRYHDKILDRAIERSKLRVKQLENSFKNLQYAVDNALGGERYAYTGEQLSNLQQQYKEVSSQLDNERGKKDSDKGAIIDYEQQLVELRQEMEQLIKTVGEEILGSSVADIASELGNAFIDAFRAGENAATAWGKKVNEIVADITRRMIIQKYLEPQLAKIIEKYIGTPDEAGLWDLAGGGDVISRIMGSLSQFSGELISLGDNFANIWETLSPALQELAGAVDGTTSLSEGIQSVTEDTASLLASYINAMRQEQVLQGGTLNQIRNLLTVNTQMKSQYLLYLQTIAAHTYDNAQAARAILDRLNSVIGVRIGGAGNAINVNA